MSIHPSLAAAGKGKKHRSVLKRYERIQTLQKKGMWAEENSVYNLPKIKIIKVKIKKVKAAEAATTETTAAEAQATAPVATKPAEKKPAEKKAADKK